MKTIKSIILLVCLTTASYSQVYLEMAMDTSMSFSEIIDQGESFFRINGRGQHTGYKAFKRWEYWMKRCLDSDGHMMSKAAVHDNFMSFQHAQQANSERAIEEISWTELGPKSSGNTNGWSSHLGRISAIGVDRNNPDHLIVGSPTGGVWKTTNCGDDWTPIYDNEAVMDIYSLAINPHDSQDYFVGTWGAGLRRSLDAGQTWFTVSGITPFSRIVDVKVSPSDPKIVVVINEGGNVFQSRNGGYHFDNALIHYGTLYDVEFVPGSNNILYVSGKDAVYKSFDAGWSFTELIGPWKNSAADYNPIMMAVCEADPNYLYALEADNGGFGALYLSKDGGLSFEVQSSNDNLDNNIMGYNKARRGGQAPRDMDIAVNPSNKNEVHVGGIMTFRSFNAGVEWEQTSHWLINDPLPFIHADIDIMQYVDGRLFIGTDGGLFISDNGAMSFTDKTAGLSIRQFYRIEISNDGEDLVGGSQDNGTGVFKTAGGWWDFLGADGMEPVIDKDDKNIIYASIQYGHVYKTVDGGVTLIGGVYQSPGRGDWVTPIVQDPILPNTIYQGKQQLHKTTDGFGSWSRMTNFVMRYPEDTIMQEIAISPNDNKHIVVGYEKQLFRTENGGTSWTDISPPFYFSNVNYIAIHSANKDWISLTLSGTQARVVQTTDGGRTWTNAMNNLPDLGAECIIYEGGPKNGVYVAMDPGVYYMNQERQDWILISDDVPNVLVAELEISGCDLYAATFGRGIWKTELLDDSVVFVDNDGDGYGDDTSPISYCSAESDYVLLGGDCNDSSPDINPNAEELCNDLDDDCDGIIDNGDSDMEGVTKHWYEDSDNDGYGNEKSVVVTCVQPDGYVSNKLDCDDTNRRVYPSARERCNGIDDDCDGFIDSEDLDVVDSRPWYEDKDMDGYGNRAKVYVACDVPFGYVGNGLDCDDNNPKVHPNRVEVCNNIDDNCNGRIDDNDDGLVADLIWYLDQDGDGYGLESQSIAACIAPSGYVVYSGDCDDENPDINPDAKEACDGHDNDCDGLTDENCDILFCHGYYLFVHSSLEESYHAGRALYSDAVLEGNGEQLFTAGNSVELLPGFEVKVGKQFEAKIEACFNGISPAGKSIKNELNIINSDLNERISQGELVRVQITNAFGQVHLVMFFKKDIDLHQILSQLSSGRFVILVESESVVWNREFQVFSE